ncbi:response regulator [Desulfobacula phenolica]|uniref:histidine kinase n=1 Tax=Desulfobacula phenolica TaxID=90732 RepID=A0A1H2JGT3_9BACT|nr:response regulator [Desulfobacula phenolica]SDU55633.1 PAS domain S-box-containing protein [Desulfobacula phenolica]
MSNKAVSSIPFEKNKFVLIVTNTGCSNILSEILSGAGYRVDYAKTCRVVLDIVKKKLPDIVIIDIQRPGNHEFELCRTLNSNDISLNIPIIFICTLPELDDKEKAFEAGCYDFITKPFFAVELLSRIKNCIMMQQHQKQLELIIHERTLALQQEQDKLRRELQIRTQNAVIRENQLKLLSLNFDISQTIIQGETITQMLQKCCELIVHHLNATFTRVWLFDEMQNVLVLQASAGMYTRINGKHSRKSVACTNKIGKIFLSKSPHTTNTIMGDLLICDQEWARQEKIVSFAGHPLVVDDKVIGVVAIFSKNILSNMVMKSLESVANAISLGVRRKLSEASLLASETRFRDLIEDTVDWIWELNHEGVYTYSSPRVFNLLGYDPGEIVGKTPFEFMPPEEGLKMQTVFREMVAGQKMFSAIENTCTHKNGNKVVLEASARPIFNDDGTLWGYRGINRDITERKNSQEALRQRDEQLRQTQKMEAIGTLAGGIAHDFNNILAAILGYTELALFDLPEESRKKHELDQVLKAGHRAKELIRQILTFSRKSDQTLRPLRVQIIAKEVVKLLRSSIPSTISIKQNIDPGCENVVADPTQIHQVFMNLCTNAYHAMKESGGVLNISLQQIQLNREDLNGNLSIKTGSCLKLEVSDTGIGIPKDIQNKIFEPYYTTKGMGEGTGLGLAVVHGIVKNLHGDITVHSEPGKGTVFCVYLPVAEEKQKNVRERSTAPVPTGKEHILLVDDDEDLARMHKQMLERLGYKVTVLTSSVETLDVFQNSPNGFDLVMTDMTMPGMTGAELARRIFKIKPDMPVILCTGYSEIINAEQAKAMGINAYLSKPILKRELADVVRTVLDETKEINIKEKKYWTTY